jgi:hypothetical protein
MALPQPTSFPPNQQLYPPNPYQPQQPGLQPQGAQQQSPFPSGFPDSLGGASGLGALGAAGPQPSDLFAPSAGAGQQGPAGPNFQQPGVMPFGPQAGSPQAGGPQGQEAPPFVTENPGLSSGGGGGSSKWPLLALGVGVVAYVGKGLLTKRWEFNPFGRKFWSIKKSVKLDQIKDEQATALRKFHDDLKNMGIKDIPQAKDDSTKLNELKKQVEDLHSDTEKSLRYLKKSDDFKTAFVGLKEKYIARIQGMLDKKEEATLKTQEQDLQKAHEAFKAQISDKLPKKAETTPAKPAEAPKTEAEKKPEEATKK